MKKINHLSMLVENINDLPAFYDMQSLYRSLSEDIRKDVSFEDYKNDLIDFCKKKKVKDFEVLEGDKLRIDSFGSYDMLGLLKYFKLSNEVYSIDGRILFKSSKDYGKKRFGRDITLDDFMRDFINVLESRNHKYFEFSHQLNFQKQNF